MFRHHAADAALFAGLAFLIALFATTAFSVSDISFERTIPVEVIPANPGAPTKLQPGILLVPGDADHDVMAGLRFKLPQPDGEHAPWVLWVQRAPVDAIWGQAAAQSGRSWHSPRYDFFHPGADELAMPVGYMFRLPADWQGDVDLQLHVRSGVRGALSPMLLNEHQLAQITHLDIALNAGAYASLFMLGLIVLVLYAVTRERAFISAFACISLGLLFVSAVNGHLLQLPGFALLGGWRSQGLWTLQLLFGASLLQLMLRYSPALDGTMRWNRWFHGYSLVLIALAALCLLDLPPLRAWMQPIAAVAWLGLGISALTILGDAVARRLAMAGWLLAVVLVTIGLAIVSQATQSGLLPMQLWIWYGYQSSLVLLLSLLSLSLLSRIGEYREERDRDQLARMDSERRVQRESARAALPLALQSRLRGLSAGDIEWAAMRIVLEHLLPQVPVRAAAVVARGYHGRDLSLVEPADENDMLESYIAANTLQLKRYAIEGQPLQQPLPGNPEPSTEALLPLRIRAPGWGLLLLRRDGSDGFSTDEMAMAQEFLRLATLHADEAVGTWNLRRSAEFDALTGTFNRRSIDQWLARAFHDADQRNQPLSLLFIDIDRFKSINDRLGHAGGDHCLREVALALRTAIEDGDFLGRYGGEEFVALLPGRAGAQAREMGERLRAAVERMEMVYESRKIKVTVSVGVSTRLERESTPAAAIERADKALYEAKRSGRNRVHVAPAIFS